MSTPLPDPALLTTDAQNRALRTLVQNLVFDVAAAVVLVLYSAFAAAHGWGDFQWAVLGFTLVKTAVVSALSYLMRKVFDSAGGPLLPPAPQPAPADPVDPVDPGGL